MRDIKYNGIINGDVYNNITDYSQTIIVKNKTEYKHTEICKEETTIGAIVKEKVVEAIVGGILTTCLPMISWFQKNRILDELTAEMNMVVLFLAIIFSLVGLVVCAVSIVNIVSGLTLRNKGSHVELQSNIKWIGRMVDALLGTAGGTQQNESVIEKFYLNVNGKIYRIIDKVCPICKTEPAGKMRLIYSNSEEKYFWRCVRNPVHKIEYDYTCNV